MNNRQSWENVCGVQKCYPKTKTCFVVWKKRAKCGGSQPSNTVANLRWRNEYNVRGHKLFFRKWFFFLMMRECIRFLSLKGPPESYFKLQIKVGTWENKDHWRGGQYWNHHTKKFSPAEEIIEFGDPEGLPRTSRKRKIITYRHSSRKYKWP